MPISKEERKAYEEGKADSKHGVFRGLLDDIAEIQYHRSESERVAYEKGLHGEQLDKDKK